MIKKIGFALLSICLLYGYAIAGNADSEKPNRDEVGYKGSGSLRSTYVLRVTSSGHVVNETGEGELGSPNYPWIKLHTATGMTRHEDIFMDLAAKDPNVVRGGITMSSATLVSAGTTYIEADLVQPATPRNVVVVATVGAGGLGQTTMTIVATAYIAGINALGIADSETVVVVSTDNAAAGLGVVAWAKITTVTVNCTSLSSIAGGAVFIQIGTNDEIGLTNDIVADTDIYHVNEAGTVTSTYVANATYNTINFATDGAGSSDYFVRYIQQYFTVLP